MKIDDEALSAFVHDHVFDDGSQAAERSTRLVIQLTVPGPLGLPGYFASKQLAVLRVEPQQPEGPLDVLFG